MAHKVSEIIRKYLEKYERGREVPLHNEIIQCGPVMWTDDVDQCKA